MYLNFYHLFPKKVLLLQMIFQEKGIPGNMAIAGIL